jgi:FG-GAP-like repeat
MTPLAGLGFRSEGLRLLSVGDFSGDRVADVMIIQGDGNLFSENGDGHGGFSPYNPVGGGWGSMRFVFGPGDFSGDGKGDVLAVTSTGDLYLYPGNGRGGFASAGQRIGNGWAGFLSAFSPRDISGDHKSDVMAVSAHYQRPAFSL